ncbi:somatostatin receptor type 2-like [Clytia hemisphaerica]|uniref:somatostatin receptor type 2-like n=1 Tax=Clytia hemisphaerica TaxID=252671 RepID=UPI0034D5611F
MVENNNTTTGNSHVEKIFSTSFSLFYIIVSLMIITFGIVASAITIYLYHHGKIARTLFNYFLMNLCISNIFQNVGALPLLLALLTESAESRSPKSRVSLKLSSMACAILTRSSIFFVGAFVTVYNISLMSFKWYSIIKKPLHRDDSKRKLTYIILGFWCVAILMVIPNLFSFVWDAQYGYCLRRDNLGVESELYKTVLFLTGLCIPIVTMLVTYALILRQFYKKSKIKLPGDRESPVKLMYRRKIMIFLGIVIGVFIFCWIPFGVYFILTMIGYFGDSSNPAQVYQSIRILRLVMIPCFCAASLNVICYGIKDEEIRKAFRDIFKGCICCRTANNNNSGAKTEIGVVDYFRHKLSTLSMSSEK